MSTLHSIDDIWLERSDGSRQLELLADQFNFIDSSITSAIEQVNSDFELKKIYYKSPTELQENVSIRNDALLQFSLCVTSDMEKELEIKMQNLIERSAKLLNNSADLSQYKTPNKGIDVQEITSSTHHDGSIHFRYTKLNKIGFEHFMPSDSRLNLETQYLTKGKGKLCVQAFADLYQADYDLFKIGYDHLGVELSVDDFISDILHGGQFDPTIVNEAWKTIRDVFKDATLLLPLYELITGEQLGTGFALTDAEKWDKSISSAIGLFSLGLGAMNLLAKGATGAQALLYMLGQK